MGERKIRIDETIKFVSESASNDEKVGVFDVGPVVAPVVVAAAPAPVEMAPTPAEDFREQIEVAKFAEAVALAEWPIIVIAGGGVFSIAVLLAISVGSCLR